MKVHRSLPAAMLASALLVSLFLASPAKAAAQMGGMSSDTPAHAKTLASPPADAAVTLNGKSVSVHYNAPSMRGRKIFGGLVPYDHWWRTGANPATLFKTQTDLTVGGATVLAGTYTLYTLPSAGTWKLIINKQTGQWGTEYDPAQDLVRVDMKKAALPSPQEKMSITFEKTSGASTELHIRWETTDVSVPVVAR